MRLIDRSESRNAGTVGRSSGPLFGAPLSCLQRHPHLLHDKNELRSFLRLLLTRAPQQHDTEQARHDEWDRRDSGDKTGT